MTAGGPPWQIYGPETREPEAAGQKDAQTGSGGHGNGGSDPAMPAMAAPPVTAPATAGPATPGPPPVSGPAGSGLAGGDPAGSGLASGEVAGSAPAAGDPASSGPASKGPASGGDSGSGERGSEDSARAGTAGGEAPSSGPSGGGSAGASSADADPVSEESKHSGSGRPGQGAASGPGVPEPGSGKASAAGAQPEDAASTGTLPVPKAGPAVPAGGAAGYGLVAPTGRMLRAEGGSAAAGGAWLSVTAPGSPLITAAPSRTPRPGLSARLTALARLIQIGESRTDAGFSKELLQDAEQLLDRAGERLRLSAGHTVVALAGGTGSGKSSLFNRMAGANLSPVGVTRPVTKYPHACVWGAEGSGPLLEWLGVPRRFRYTRRSALDTGESSLNGLVLLDLPDHDSVATGITGQVDKLVGMADLMVWVLDPQKYADAAVHRRYLVPLAGHSDVIAIVLNQSDLLSPAELEDTVGDLRRLLDSEGLHDVPVLATSAQTGAGMDRLRTLLVDTVSERRATGARISADLDGIAAEFTPYVRQPEEAPPADAGPGQDGVGIPPGGAEQLVDAFSHAAGVSAVSDALQSANELRAVDFIGWPVIWPVERLSGRDPVRKARLGTLWEEVRGTAAGPSGAQQAEIDSALTRLADEVSQPLPRPWSQTTRSAARSGADQIPAALAAAVGTSLPREDRIAPWWRLVGALQGVLLACIFLSLLWIGAVLAFGVFHVASNIPWLLGDWHLLPWGIILIAAFLLLGWVIAAGCMNLVRSGAARDRQRMEEIMRAGIGAVVGDMVILPVERELAEYHRFRDELGVATGARAPAA
jgi:hypothetical protein